MLLGVTQSKVFCYGRADFLLRGSGFYIDPRKKSGWHGRFDGVFLTGHCALMRGGTRFAGYFSTVSGRVGESAMLIY